MERIQSLSAMVVRGIHRASWSVHRMHDDGDTGSRRTAWRARSYGRAGTTQTTSKTKVAHVLHASPREPSLRGAELRATVGQHVLFSTLNTLYALSLDQSTQAPRVILKLADLMRYILYECQVPRVPLAKELAFLERYLELERLRVVGKMKVHLHVVGLFKGQQVAPLLFISLVEYAFKHGVQHRSDGAFLHIQVHIPDDETIAFSVEKSTAWSPTGTDQASYDDLALNAIQKRLVLLYPGMHQFEATVNECLYHAQLTIPAR
ncbi:MAG: histidine kinase [Bacteroidota bacterium]